jgi:Xaa-Pro dipeptidase
LWHILLLIASVLTRLCRVNEPNCSLLYDIRNDVLTLFVPRIDEKRVIWTGRGSNPAEALDRYDIDEAFWTDTLQTFVRDWLISNPGNIYALHTFYEDVDLSGPRHHLDLYSLQPAMNLARMVKDEHEVKMIRKANDISSQAHKLVLANIARFKNEAQVEGLFLDVCTSMQAKQQAYDIIAASGPNAGTLHYDENNQDFEDRQLMCLDAGCEYMLYASDITRTFPLSGKWPSKEAEDIYMLVQRMQETCIKRIAPGVRYLDLHVLAHQIAIDGLLNLGILHNGSREEIYKTGTSKAFFPHGLGHHVGLEVHDVGQADLMSTINGNTVRQSYQV